MNGIQTEGCLLGYSSTRGFNDLIAEGTFCFEFGELYCGRLLLNRIRLRWAAHVARTGESRNAHRVLVGRPRRRWEDNIKMDLRDVGYDDREWINLAQDRDRWRAYVKAAMNLRRSSLVCWTLCHCHVFCDIVHEDRPSKGKQRGIQSGIGTGIRCGLVDKVSARRTENPGEALRNATEPVHSGFDLNEAATKFGVLKATLASRSKYPVEGKVFFGPRPVLGEAICNNIREMTHTCF
ncbi:hypothetical protein ANN_06028 [Periplaneta americana]|uniref:Uncharacterized protein n=1 Tax=Periplaneta americana TaxID=6978 RepID=A0ABQ8TCE7_PERAM|nr:hypothetical protein ANN_06028 [Periplaneta americana]